MLYSIESIIFLLFLTLPFLPLFPTLLLPFILPSVYPHPVSLFLHPLCFHLSFFFLFYEMLLLLLFSNFSSLSSFPPLFFLLIHSSLYSFFSSFTFFFIPLLFPLQCSTKRSQSYSFSKFSSLSSFTYPFPPFHFSPVFIHILFNFFLYPLLFPPNLFFLFYEFLRTLF